MMPRRFLHPTALLVLALGTATTWSGSSRASDQPAAETPAAQATRFYQQGNVEFEKKNWTAAEAAYLKAWAITRTFDVAANLGEVAFHLGKLRQAAGYLSYSLRTAPPSSKPAQRERTTHFLEQATEKLGAVRVRARVEGAPGGGFGIGPGIKVSINGQPIADEDGASTIFVDPGPCTVIAKREGYVERRQVVDVKAGTLDAVSITLQPVPREHRSIVLPIMLGAASAVGLGLGIAMTAVSNGKSTDADAQRAAILESGGQCAKPSSTFVGPCGDLKSSLKALDTTANVARVAYVASGLLAIGAVTYALLPQPEPTKTGWVRAAPVIGASGGGIVVVGAW